MADLSPRPSGANSSNNNEPVVGYPPPMSVVRPTPLVDGSEFDLRRIWLAIVESKWLIGGATLAVTLAFLIFTLFSRMDFHVEGSMYLGDAQSSKSPTAGRAGEMLDFLGSLGQSEVGAELEVIRSRTLVDQAIRESGLNVSLEPIGWRPMRYLRWRLSLRNRDLLADTLLAHNTTKISSRLADESLQVVFGDKGTFRILYKDETLGNGRIGEAFISPDLEITIDVNGKNSPPPQGTIYLLRVASMDDAYEEVHKRFAASIPYSKASQEIAILRVEITDKSPFRAARFIDGLMRGYLDQHLSWKTEEAGATEAFVNKQLDKVRESLDSAEQRLTDFKTKSGVVMLTEEAKARITQLADYEKQRVAAKLQVQALTQITRVLKRRDAPIESYLVSQAGDEVLAAMTKNLADTQQQMKKLEEENTGTSPVMREETAIANKQRDLIAGYIKSKLAQADAMLRDLDTQISGYDQKLKTLPEAELQMAAFVREIEVFGKLYAFLLEKQEQAQISKASTISKTRVLDRAILPARESSPKLRENLTFGLLLGLMLGLIAAFLTRKLANSFQSESEIRRAFASAPLFGTIPHKLTKQPNGSPAATFQTVFENDLKSEFAEAYRLLRTNLYYSALTNREKVLLVTSPTSGDGKTLTSLNLAHTLALDGKRVLVIDGDMRKPSHHVLLRLPQHPGLSAILTAEKPWQDVVRNVFTSKGSVDSITTGIVPPNPAELLSSPSLPKFLMEARQKYDFVLIDSPPFPPVSDSLVMAMLADRVLSVFRVRNTRRGMADEHLRKFASMCQRYGLVINDVALSPTYGYGYGGRYGGYGYGYGQTKSS
jgi:tyrosine-protein kinase Etk/Wzc